MVKQAMVKQLLSKEEKLGKMDELKALGFIIFILFPAVSIVGVGSYGFTLWMIQLFGGVVTH